MYLYITRILLHVILRVPSSVVLHRQQNMLRRAFCSIQFMQFIDNSVRCPRRQETTVGYLMDSCQLKEQGEQEKFALFRLTKETGSRDRRLSLAFSMHHFLLLILRLFYEVRMSNVCLSSEAVHM